MKTHQALDEVWTVDGDTAICKLDEHCVLFVSREEDGIRMRVKDYTDSAEKPKLIYSNFIGDMQLGHIYRVKKK